MKNTMIRAFVLSLAVTGFGAATVASHARTTAKASLVAPPQSLTSPVPTCLPSMSQCGLD